MKLVVQDRVGKEAVEEMQEKVSIVESTRTEMMHDADKIEAVHQSICEKYAELKEQGLVVSETTAYEDVFKSYITKVRTLLNAEVSAWTEALKEAEAKVKKTQLQLVGKD